MGIAPRGEGERVSGRRLAAGFFFAIRKGLLPEGYYGFGNVCEVLRLRFSDMLLQFRIDTAEMAYKANYPKLLFLLSSLRC